MKSLLLALCTLVFAFAGHAQCPAVYRVGGGGAFCGTPVNITLSGSDTGVTYQLYFGGSPYGGAVSGTGSALSWSITAAPAITSATSYFEVGARSRSCFRPMSDSAVIYDGLDTVIGGLSRFCWDDTLTFNAGVSTDVYFRPTGVWSASDTSIAELLSTSIPTMENVGAHSAGTFTLFYTVTNGCGTFTSSKLVTVDSTPERPSIIGPSSVCVGSSVLFSTPSAYYTIWSVTSGTVASITSVGNLVALSAGSTAVICQAIGTCGIDSSIFNITVANDTSSGINVTAPFYIPRGSSGLVTTTGSGGAWSIFPALDASISSTGLVSVPAHGTYNYAIPTYNYTATCGAASQSSFVNLIDTSATPASDSFYVDIQSSCVPWRRFTIRSASWRSGLRFATVFGDGNIDTTNVLADGYFGIDTFSHWFTSGAVYQMKFYLIDGTRIIDSLTKYIDVRSLAINGPNAILVGTSDTLSVTPTFSGSWSLTGSTIATVNSATGIVRGLSTGRTTITYSTSRCWVTRILDILPSDTHFADSFAVYTTDRCSGPLFHVYYGPAISYRQIGTYFGDGSYSVVTLRGSRAIDTFSHYYATSGTYTVKQVFYPIATSTPVDTIIYSYTYNACSDAAITLYYDVDSNCSLGSSDIINTAPFNVAVDSNGIRVDTVSLTSGTYYPKYGPTGTVYAYYILGDSAAGITVTCPSSGILYDTVTSSGYSSTLREIALHWIPGTSYDLSINTSRRTGRHSIWGNIAIDNRHIATGATVTLTYDTSYTFYRAWPSPTSISGGVATWSVSSIVPGATPTRISYQLETPSGTSYWHAPGDTIVSIFRVAPYSGDMDTTNNYVKVVDTVRSSFDPNYVAVSPEGGILNGTQLAYTIHFENDGNDTARNIHVLDTLSANVDPSTIRIVTATAPMYVSYTPYGSRTIVKFDFPSINLPDSSHHNQCTGFVTYTVKARTGLADGIVINNRAGIYFDDNEVVLTGSVTNTIVIPSISIAASDTSICAGDTVTFTGVWHSVPNHHFQWLVNGVVAGSDATTYVTDSLRDRDVVTCRLLSLQDDTVTNISTGITINIAPTPSAGSLSYTGSICVGDSAMLLSTGTPGGVWSTTSGRINITGSLANGTTVGADTIVYTVTGRCGTAIGRLPVSVNPSPFAGSITAPSSLCAGDTATIGTTGGGGTWTVSGGHTTLSGARITAFYAGVDTIRYAVTNSCGSAVAMATINVIPVLTAGTITAPASLCFGDTARVTTTGSGGTWAVTSGHVSLTGTVLRTVSTGSDTIIYTASNSCGTSIARATVMVVPVLTSGTLSAPASLCAGDTATISTTGSGGTWTVTGGHTSLSGTSLRAVSAGIDTIRYTASNSCGTSVALRTINILPLPSSGVVTAPASICFGDSARVSTTGTGGTWSVTRGHVTISAAEILHTVSAGTDTVVYTATNSCGTSIGRAAVNVIALPFAGTITSPSSICNGDSLSLTTTGSGGTWSISGTHSTVTGSVLRASAAGIDTIVYTATNSCGTSIARQAINVVVVLSAGVISLPYNVCTGDSILLSTTGFGGTWSVLHGHATVAGAIFTVVSVGVDTLKYTASNSCGTSIALAPFLASATVTPFVSIYATPSGSVCAGDSVVFTATSINGGSAPQFEWRRFGSVIDSGSTFSYAPALSDAISCQMTSSEACPTPRRTLSNTLTMLVNPVVTPSIAISSSVDSITASGVLVRFYSTVTFGGTATTYQWYVNSSPIPGASNNTFSFHAIIGDSVYCVITSNAPCATLGTVHSDVIVINGLFPELVSYSGATPGSVRLYPNPNDGNFTIAGDFTDGKDGEATYQVLDVTGRMWITGSSHVDHGHLVAAIAAGNIASGYYTVKLTFGDSIVYFHFVVSQ